MYIQSLALTSATFASATTNLIPVITFVLAISFRLERLGWATPAGKAKVLGTLMGIGGAMLLTFYKGVDINIWKTHVDLLHNSQHHGGHVAETHHRVLGSLLALGSCICYALWLILQAKMSEQYPCPYSSTALMSLMGSIQGVVFALCTERDWGKWKLGWNIRLLTVAYSGILGSGLMFTFIAWCVRMRGPLFVSIFNPMMLVLVAIAGSLVLDEKLHLGSVLGAILIVCGLYVVLWGKRKEMKRISQLMPEIMNSSTAGDSETIHIAITSSTSQNNSNSSDRRSNTMGVSQNSNLKADNDEAGL
ncbi:unnamed protein product [Ilex paraguariensis]|uniref:WAT1-related protein n=1 Tax=Ilex paraguariensis TaxID=185542 RepID=A0ABC8T0D8_9AQUA